MSKQNRFPDLITRDWHPTRWRVIVAMPGAGPGFYGTPLSAPCTNSSHAEAGAWCVLCKNTGRIAPAPRPCAAVP